MGGTGRRTTSSLAEVLHNEPYAFDFFQTVRLMLRLRPDRSPIGLAARPEKEVVRVHSRLTLEFPASAIHDLKAHPENGQPPDLTVAFMGLTGTQGVLPQFYTEWMLLRETHKDSAMAAFFDLFNHRWISLMYRAWEKFRLPIAFERLSLGQKRGVRIARNVFDLVGLGTQGLENRLEVSDSTLVYYAGLIAQRSRSAPSLRGLLRDYFQVPVQIVQFIGNWYELGEGDRCFLNSPGLHNQLGVGAVIGDAVWDSQGHFEVRIGPIGYQDFRNFLPDGRAAHQLCELIRIFAGPVMGFRMRLVLRGDELPASRLGDDSMAPRLGWDLWLDPADRFQEADDAVFEEAA
jgi:type VI secretion system protein ImpH